RLRTRVRQWYQQTGSPVSDPTRRYREYPEHGLAALEIAGQGADTRDIRQAAQAYQVFAQHDGFATRDAVLLEPTQTPEILKFALVVVVRGVFGVKSTDGGV